MFSEIAVLKLPLAIRQQIRNGWGESPEDLRDLSVSLDRVGDVLRMQGEAAEALELYRESLAIRQQIGDRWGESPEYLRDLLRSHVRVAMLVPEEATMHLAKAHELLTSIFARGWNLPEDDQLQIGLRQLASQLEIDWSDIAGKSED